MITPLKQILPKPVAPNYFRQSIFGKRVSRIGFLPERPITDRLPTDENTMAWEMYTDVVLQGNRRAIRRVDSALRDRIDAYFRKVLSAHVGEKNASEALRTLYVVFKADSEYRQGAQMLSLRDAQKEDPGFVALERTEIYQQLRDLDFIGMNRSKSKFNWADGLTSKFSNALFETKSLYRRTMRNIDTWLQPQPPNVLTATF